MRLLEMISKAFPTTLGDQKEGLFSNMQKLQLLLI